MQQIGPSGPAQKTLGDVRASPSIELSVQLEQWAKAGENIGKVKDLPDLVRAFVNLESEAWRLNNRRREREREAAAARRAQALLQDMQGLEGVLERPVGVLAESPVACHLPGHNDHEYVALLLGGNRTCLALCTDILQPARRTCHWSVDFAFVDSVIIRDRNGGVVKTTSTSGESLNGAGADGQDSSDLTVTILLSNCKNADAGSNSAGKVEGFWLNFSSSAVQCTQSANADESSGREGGAVEIVLRRASGAAGRGWFDLPGRGEIGGEPATSPGAGATGVTAEAVPLEEFAVELTKAVEAEKRNRLSRSDSRHSKLAEALLDWHQIGRSNAQ